MRVLEGTPDTWEAEPHGWATVGVLDGVHLGHRALLGSLTSHDSPSTVLTFDPHPIEVLVPDANPRLITTLSERLSLLESVGVDQVGVLDLKEIREFTAKRFVAEILVGQLEIGGFVAGPDFRFGRDREGEMGLLRDLGKHHDFSIQAVELLDSDGVVSSSRIRDVIEHGKVLEASTLLGSRYRMSGEVIHGDERGREIGFPTANVEPPSRKVIPGNGVYAAMVEVGGERHQAAVNVGVRPTFGAGSRLVEAFVFDFDEDLYGQVINIEFVSWIRPELRFDSVEALVARMAEDVTKAKSILAPIG